jgi:hypothetical protein
MRDVEDKTQLRKACEIETSRERAANRLQPKNFDKDTQTRLHQLRAARECRLDGQKVGRKAVIPVDATKSQPNIIKEQHKGGWTTALTNHGMFMRAIVVLILVILLFGLLYMDGLFERYMVGHHGTWWMGRRRDFVSTRRKRLWEEHTLERSDDDNNREFILIVRIKDPLLSQEEKERIQKILRKQKPKTERKAEDATISGGVASM